LNITVTTRRGENAGGGALGSGALGSIALRRFDEHDTYCAHLDQVIPLHMVRANDASAATSTVHEPRTDIEETSTEGAGIQTTRAPSPTRARSRSRAAA